MKEFYFTLDRSNYEGPNETGRRHAVVSFRQKDNIWKKFTEFERKGEVTFSPDGKIMHIAKGTENESVIAGLSVRALAPCLSVRARALCVCQHRPTELMFSTTTRVMTRFEPQR